MDNCSSSVLNFKLKCSILIKYIVKKGVPADTCLGTIALQSIQLEMTVENSSQSILELPVLNHLSL